MNSQVTRGVDSLAGCPDPVVDLLYDVEIFWMGAVLGATPVAIAKVCDGWRASTISARRAHMVAERRDFRWPSADIEPRGGSSSDE